MEIRKQATFLQVISKLIIDKFFKDLTNHKKKTNRVVVFSCRPFPNILITEGPPMRTSKKFGK